MAHDMNKHYAEHILGLVGCGEYNMSSLREAYRKMAKVNHPDLVEARGGNVDEAARKMAEINAAHQYLSGVFETLGVESLEASTGDFYNFDDSYARSSKAGPAASSHTESETANQAANQDVPPWDWNNPFFNNAFYGRPTGAAGAQQAHAYGRTVNYAHTAKSKSTGTGASAPTMPNVKIPGWHKVLSKLFNLDWVWRVIMMIIAMNLFTMVGGVGTHFNHAVMENFPMGFVIIVLFFNFASLFNLFTGKLTRRMMKACTWAINSMIGLK